jgi:membrane protein YdbS with pleckstrin-like domain
MIDRIFIPLVGITWLIAVIYIAILYARAKFEVITLEESAIRHTRGVLAQKSVVLSYSKITEATYTQTIFQRVIGIGNMHLDSAGGSMMAIHIMDVKKADIDKTMENARKKSGDEDGT